AVPEPPRAGRRAGVSHLEPSPEPRAGAGANRAQPRASGAVAAAQHEPANHAGAFLIDLDGDGEKRRRSRTAGDGSALARAGDSSVDAAVDRRLLEHRQRAEPERAVRGAEQAPPLQEPLEKDKITLGARGQPRFRG